MSSPSRLSSTTPVHWLPPTGGPNDSSPAVQNSAETGASNEMAIDPALLNTTPVFGPGVSTPPAADLHAPAAMAGQKRPRQTDLSQWARNKANFASLPRDACDEIVLFAQLDGADQASIVLYIKQLELEKAFEGSIKVNVAAPWVPSSLILAFIYEEAFETIVDPTIPNYVNMPKEVTGNRLRQETQYNFNLIHMDAVKAGIIKTKTEKKLTDARLKVTDVESVSTKDGQRIDVFTMCCDLNQLPNRRKRPLQTPSVAMIGRFAFVRYCFAEAIKLGKTDGQFWPYINWTLQKLRTDNNNDNVKISQVLHSILVDDLALYGTIDTNKIHLDTEAVLA